MRVHHRYCSYIYCMYSFSLYLVFEHFHFFPLLIVVKIKLLLLLSMLGLDIQYAMSHKTHLLHNQLAHTHEKKIVHTVTNNNVCRNFFSLSRMKKKTKKGYVGSLRSCDFCLDSLCELSQMFHISLCGCVTLAGTAVLTLGPKIHILWLTFRSEVQVICFDAWKYSNSIDLLNARKQFILDLHLNGSPKTII